MYQLKTDVQLDFSAILFANRKKEQNFFSNAINKGMYVDLYGISGQGKTQFLGWVMHTAKSNQDLGVYINFSQAELHEGEFIHLLRVVSEQLCHKEEFAKDPFSSFNEKMDEKLSGTLNDDVETDLIEKFNTAFYVVLKSHKVLLCLDDIEEGNLLVQKFEREVLRYYTDMPNLMLVTAGQKPMHWETFTLRDRVEPYPLECLDEEGTQEKIQRLYDSRGIEVNVKKEVDISKLFKLTQGHPLSIDTLLESWTTDKSKGNWRLEITEGQYKQSIDLLIEEVIEKRILKNLQLGSDYPPPIEILLRIALLRHIQRKVQRRVLAGFVSDLFKKSPFFSDRLLIQFQKAHILDWKEGVEYVLHPLIHSILLEKMRLTSKKEFIEIQRGLVSIYKDSAMESKDDTDARITNFIEMLYHRAVLLREESVKKDEINKLLEKDVHNYLGKNVTYGSAQQRSELDGLKSRLEYDRELRELTDMESLLDLLDYGKETRNAA